MKPNSTGIAARMMLSIDRARISEALLNNRQLQSTPLQIRYPQGVREALGIMSEQLSLSVSDLTRILVEDALTEMFLPAENIVHRLICRTEHIMQAHDVCVTTMTTLLAPWNIRPAVFRDPDKLADYLTGEILTALADWFYLNPEWLNGRVRYPLSRAGEW
ncbi:conjugal transfer protein TraE, partial [Escherichia coli]|nr:conjugal transfer protein TraE [Escherichia coli]